jgi:fibro-slime domain-containing protein
MTVPVTYRDFLLGGDFYAATISGSNNAVAGMVQGTLDSEGKPVYAGVGGTGMTGGWVTSAASFHNWYRDVPGTNTTYVSTILLHNDGNGSFVNWWKDNQEWMSYSNARFCSDATCTSCNAPAYVDDGTMQCFASCTPWGTGSGPCVANQALVPGNPLFFPLDNIPGMITPTSAYAPGETPPMYSGTWAFEPGTPQPLHNFSFTSEVRYWFSYSTSKQYTLDFESDDDLWVFVNRKLAVDLGGIHNPVEGRIVFDASGGGEVTVTPTGGAACKTEGALSTCTSTKSTVSLGMSNNGVYEIVVFQAERSWNGSSFRLTLSGFNEAPSECTRCGDGSTPGDGGCSNATGAAGAGGVAGPTGTTGTSGTGGATGGATDVSTGGTGGPAERVVLAVRPERRRQPAIWRCGSSRRLQAAPVRSP